MSTPARAAAVPCAIAVGLALAAHAVALGGGFVWDDFSHVEYALARPFDLAELFQPGMRFRPLLYLPGQLDALVWGARPFGWHLTNVLLHAVAAGLFAWIARRLLASRGATLVAAALFAAHPATSEAVAWVMGRGDLLAAVLGLAACVAAARSSAEEPRGGVFTLLTGVFVLGAMLAKETGVIWLAVAPLAGWMAAARWTSDAGKRLAAVLVAAVAVFALLRAANVGPTGATTSLLGGLLSVEGFRLAFLAAGHYVRESLLLVSYVPFRRSVPQDPFTIALAAAAFAASIAVLARARARPAAALGVLWFWAGIAPAIATASQPVSTTAVAARHLYAALPGLALLLGDAVTAAVAGLDSSRRLVRRVGAACGVVAALGLVLLTSARDRVWREDEALWNAVLVHEPQSRYAWGNLGLTRLGEARFDDAERAFAAAVASTDPGPFMVADVAAQHAMLAAADGRLDEAGASLAAAAAVPADAEGAATRARAAGVVAVAEAATHRDAGSRLRFFQALQALEASLGRGADPVVAFHLGRIAERAGERVDAEALFRRCDASSGIAMRRLGDEAGRRADALRAGLEAEPDPVRARWNAARAALRELRWKDAAATLADWPDRADPLPLIFLAEARARTGDLAGAIEANSRALALAPDFVELHRTEASMRAAMRDYEGAARAWEQVLRLEPDSWTARLALADAWAAAGDERAERVWREIAEQATDAGLRAEAARRLAGRRGARPPER